MRFAAGITLYNADENQIHRLLDYAESFDIIYILDNSDNSVDYRIYFKCEKYEYIGMEGNVGLPVAYNILLNQYLDSSIDYLCTLDQDSTFESKQIQNLKDFIEKFDEKESRNNKREIGIFAPTIYYTSEKSKSEDSFEEKRRVITSGAFLSTRMIRKYLFKYDENYFIDKFEIDLCEQIIRKNLKIVVYKNSVLYQELGDKKGAKRSWHSVLRHYYLFRNRLYFNRKFFFRPKRYVLNILQTGRHLGLILMYEPKKANKIMQIFPAIRDYLKGNMGKRI